MKMKEKNKKKGISLIVLVITIIVIIILAAAVILTVNNNNPMSNANKARYESDRANVQNALSAAVGKISAEKLCSIAIPAQADISTGIEYTLKGANDGVVGGKIGWDTAATNVPAGYETNTILGMKMPKYGSDTRWFTNGSGEVSVEVGGSIYGPGGTVEKPLNPGEIASVNTNYTVDGKTAVIPKGFAISTITQEQSIDGGLVIKDEQGNEFVWIPVDNLSDFARVDWVKGYTIAEAPEDENTAEYIAMKESVGRNGGYYIARYEAGIPGTTSSVTTNHNTITDGSIKPVSKPNVGVWNFIAWGVNSNTETPGNGAVTVARAMYSNNATNQTGVVSTLCYDVQWDQALKFIEKTDTTYPKDSTGKGNYSGTNATGDTFSSIAVTGAHSSFMKNNISDMAGNTWEWTMASYSTFNRVFRGGSYSTSGSSSPAGSRNYGTCSYGSNSTVGLRITLYIK